MDDSEGDSGVATKSKRVDEKKCSDLIVLGLAWKTTDKELREYFAEMGELLMAQVKKDPKTGMSKGFGFIRFADFENQVKAITKRHFIDGRWCDVRIPISKDGSPVDRGSEYCRKIFIGRVTSEINNDDLRDYFNKYGIISDIFIPKPFRGFAFVTFSELFLNQEITPDLFGDDHIIKGISVHVSNAVPKAEMSNQYQHNSYQHQQHNPHPPNPYGGGNSSSKPYGRYSSYPSYANHSSYGSSYHQQPSYSNNGNGVHMGSNNGGGYGSSAAGSSYSSPSHYDQWAYNSNPYNRGPPPPQARGPPPAMQGGGGYGSESQSSIKVEPRPEADHGMYGDAANQHSIYNANGHARSRYAVGDNSYNSRDYYQ